MNILSRLKKLESVTDTGAVCVCEPKLYETYTQDLGADAETHEPILTSSRTPEVCPKCGKVTEIRKIVVQICDATTPERFPEEWAKGTIQTK